MKESCISHPANESLVILRQWQTDAFGDATVSALLSYFEYWHNVKRDSVLQAAHANRVAAIHGDQPSQDESFLQYHTLEEITDGILGIARRTKVSKAIARLTEVGIVSKHSNPNDRYKFDRTTYYLFHPDVVNAYLEARNLAISESSDLNDGENRYVFSWSEYERWSFRSERTITKTTSKTSSLEERTDSFSSNQGNQTPGQPLQPTAELEPQQLSPGQSPPVEKNLLAQQDPNPKDEGSAAWFNSSQRMEDQFNAGADRHPHPDLVKQGLDKIHQGTRFSDWTEAAIAVARTRKQLHEPGSSPTVAECKDYISNLLRMARTSNPPDYSRLETLQDEALLLEYRQRVASQPPEPADESGQSPFVVEETPEERKARRAAIALAKANLRTSA